MVATDTSVPRPLGEGTAAMQPHVGPTPPPTRTWTLRLKHVLLKGIDLTALGFLEPIVRLCYGEEPRQQLARIGRFVLIPLLVFAAFLAAWAVLGPSITTKSGALPSPAVVWEASGRILAFHGREQAKAAAFLRTGSDRVAALARVEARLATVQADIGLAREGLARSEAASRAELATLVAPLQQTLAEAEVAYRVQSAQRQQDLQDRAAGLAATDHAGKAALLEDLRAHGAWQDARKAEQQEMRAAVDALLSRKVPAVFAAQQDLTALAEEELFLSKMSEFLGPSGRELKVVGIAEKVAEAEERYATASGPELFGHARRILLFQSTIEKAQNSSYAGPWTLPQQTVRSVVCVFFGFLIGSLIAIPVGICCGLSPTFMAAMTPFIAIFKPVSPIVWLPIAMIIVTGLIPDPDTHWFTGMLWSLPWIGDLKINPAFIASATTVALCSLWATMVNTALGVASVDKDHLNVAKVLRLGFWSRLFTIILPSALPLIFAGLRISLGVGWMVLIAAELLAGSEGIGKYVWDNFSNGSSESFANMIVVVFVVGLIGLVLDRIMIVFQRLVSFEGSVAAI